MQPEESEFLVLGAGMAGLAAARCLQEAGREVLVLDKGRRIGGRCATRRIAGFSFDHGAQYVTARGPDFASLCEAARQAGLLAEWVSPAGKNVLSGRQAMRDLPGFLGQGLTIRQEVEITRIHREAGRYHLFAGQQLVARAEKLVLSAPAPQTAGLLDGLSDRLAASARLARYDPCWTVLLGFVQPAFPPDGAAEDADGPVSWARWQSRDGRCSLVLQAGPDWSRQWLEAPAEQVTDTIWQAFRGRAVQEKAAAPSGWLNASPAYAAAHRWLYARLARAVPEEAPRLSADKSLCLAGDWLAGPRVEAAWQSGRQAATALLAG
ncbi:MAG: FAD-dependent oxidoreductase [Alphaproteobacteria bacterium]|jgi:renalase|nr:FAD-dependent oxidoreductase [Alphaproteobacteria bacterium]